MKITIATSDKDGTTVTNHDVAVSAVEHDGDTDTGSITIRGYIEAEGKSIQVEVSLDNDTWMNHDDYNASELYTLSEAIDDLGY